MRRVIFATGMLILFTSLFAAANPIAWPPWGDIILCHTTDNCNGFFEAVPGLISIDVVATGISAPQPGSGIMACQFSVPIGECFNGVYLDDITVYPVTLGNSQTGVAIGLGVCKQPPVHVLTIQLWCSDPGDECCFLWVRPAPLVRSGEIELVDCNETLYYGTGGAAIINPDHNYCMQYVATQESTWGKVKSLYAE